MARAALRRRLTWQLATVVDRAQETPRVHTIVLDGPDWAGHLPGQHIDVRLTAEDGYQAQRSYSIATPPDGSRIAITVERLDDGEVSPYLTDELVIGDRLELRGPIGGYFVWQPGQGGPLLLAGGGSGVVPLMAMLRARVAANDATPVRCVLSWRTVADVIYRGELDEIGGRDGVEVIQTLTRSWSDDWAGRRGRVDRALLADVAWAPGDAPHTYICGPTGFVEAVASMLIELGHDAASIRTERFGPTGG